MEIPTFIVIFIGSIHSRDGTSVPGQWDISYSGVGHQEGGKGRKFHLSRIQRKGTSVINKRWDIKTELGPVFYRRWDTKTEEGGRGFIRAEIQKNKYRGREHQF